MKLNLDLILKNINAKQENIDKSGFTFHKVKNIESYIKNNWEILIALQSKQQQFQELVRTNFSNVIEMLLKIIQEKVQEVVELKNLICEQKMQNEKLIKQLQNENLKQK